jgi:outer membrane autotransporter protein
VKYEPFIGVSALYEFLGDNSASVASGGYVLKATDDISGVLGQVTAGINAFSLADDGLSGFIKGNVEFGEHDYIGYGGTVGVRLDW